MALPRATVRVTPDRSVFTGETVTLKCEIEDQYRSLNWTYLWYKDTTWTSVFEGNILIIRAPSDQDKFWCRGERDGRPSSSQYSDHVTLSVKGLKPKLTSDTEGSVLTGNTVTLKCHIDHWSAGWKFYWYKHTQNIEKTTTEANSYTIHSFRVSDGGQYWCRAGRGNPDYYTDYSDVLWINVKESPKPVVSVDPDKQLFRGETVTLRCDIQDTGDTEWTYSWTVEKTNYQYTFNRCNKLQECKINNIQPYNSGKYTCRGKIREQNTEMSDAVTLNVSSDKPQTVLSVSPHRWLTEGDSVTLMCEVISSSTGWTISWFAGNISFFSVPLVSVSSGGSKGIYTVSSVTVRHTGVYMCRAERGDPVYHTEYSNTHTLWITGVSPSVSLIIRPNRSQHFSSESLSLSCEDHSNSTGWTVRRYTDKLKPCSSSDWRSTGTTSTCTIRSLITSDTGVYWCQSESGEKLHPVNISVHNVDVILDSPVHPVTEGDPLTLRCLYRYKNPSNMRAKFYKDGSVVQSQTTGDMMIIPTVSKSHEGFYYCKHPERGESPKSWISIRASGSSSLGLTVGLCLGLSVMFLIFFLVWCYKNKKLSQSPSAVSQQQNISQTSDQTQTEDTPLQTDNVSESVDLNYANIELEPKKEMETREKEKKGINSEREDTVYSKLKKSRDQGGASRTSNSYSDAQNDQPVTISMGLISLPLVLLLISNIHSEQTEDVKPTLTVQPQTSVFIGDSVTLICEVHQSTGWEFIFINPSNTEFTETTGTKRIRSVQVSDGGEYKCRARRKENPQVYTQYSEPITVTVNALPRATVRVTPDRSVFTGETVTLKCEIEDQYRSLNWRYMWYKGRTGTSVFVENIYTIRSPSDQDEFTCRGERDGRPSSSQYSDHVTLSVKGHLKPVVSVDPDKQLFRGETVTLRCDIQDTGDTEWTYSWTVEKTNNRNIITQCNTQECKINNIQYYHSDKYTCRGKIREHNTEMSDAVTLTVSSDKPQTVLSVSPQQWLTEGDSVTLMCRVKYFSTGWTFSWFTVQMNKDVDYELVSNSSGGPKGIYTVRSVTVKHTGVYMCRAERGDPVYHTEYSNTQTLWITCVSPSVSLIIRPNRSQHFSSESLSLSCEDHSNSTGWTVRRYTDKLKPCSSSDMRSTGTTSTCTIRSLITSDTGVYWCQSESGEKLHPVNISVHYVGVILDSPVHPVTEGDPLTLRCLYRYKNPSNMRAEFYKDGSVVQSQTTGDMMIIPKVSMSHEGFYYCKYPERGESPKSWISVRGDTFISSVSGSMRYRGLIAGVVVGVSVMFLSIFLVLWSNRKKEGSSYALKENTSEGDDIMYSKLKKGEDQDVASGSSDVTNAQKK
ncbi:uncharacterized protein [Paramisgurnus dabryanus]|uniref:uncharacterized protein n=1 Tax=Paramisgurnus dabryanus TaxID=90735 RepID=UPI003CCF02F0